MNPDTITLEITQRQHDLIAQADAAVKRASENRNLIVQSIVAGHDVPTGSVFQGVQADPPGIVVQLPATETTDGS